MNAQRSDARKAQEEPEDVERIARAFHEAYERLAPEHSYETREASAVAWEDVPEDNRSLMLATVDDLLASRTIRVGIR